MPFYKAHGLDIREQMRRGVAHFRHLGLDCIRLHTIDVEFSTKEGETRGGFSADWTIQEMASDPRAWAIQERFLREFANHVNRFTGRRYADDPAIIAFEPINEPHYPKDWPDAKVPECIDRLAAALRATGTDKPVFSRTRRRSSRPKGSRRSAPKSSAVSSEKRNGMRR